MDVVYSRDWLSNKNNQKRNDNKNIQPDDSDKAGEHFDTLVQAASEVNKRFESKGITFRFYIYKEDSEVMINLVRLGGNGEVLELAEKNITHKDFSWLVASIEKGEGLYMEMVV